MKKDAVLARSKPGDNLPFANAVRANGYLFTSSIYPQDDKGRIVGADPVQGTTVASPMSVQASTCFERLFKLLEEMGSSPELIVKVDVHLANVEGYYEFLLVWRKFFPDDPPARTVIEVGQTFPFPDALLNIDAVALLKESGLKKQAFCDDPDPMELEWAPDAVRAGNLVFCSGFPAIDFQTGLAVGKPEGFPHYGSEPTMQAVKVFDRLDRVLKKAGSSVESIVESHLYEPDLMTFNDVDLVWGDRMTIPPARSSMGIKGLTVPGAVFVPNFIAVVPDDEHEKQDPREGINWHPDERKVNFSPTIKAGPWLFFAGQVPCDDFSSVPQAPKGLPYHSALIESHTRITLELLKKQMESNGTDWEHCVHVRVFLIEPERDYRGFIRVWREYFPDPSKAPAVSYVPSTTMMFDGPLVEIDPTCVVKS
ncbi:RidA family protein [Ruegeria sp. EL01]|jgi:enamine deaminase RidA (YjgF/YER057c/UK114 family)|uniref:RidA family protein n=1 Tax=Ruegeria sp. EL01 TaxID=2107578 RepID=UPI0013C53057|nr:RidA family protein [Ruegeria sp. EL01]